MATLARTWNPMNNKKKKNRAYFSAFKAQSSSSQIKISTVLPVTLHDIWGSLTVAVRSAQPPHTLTGVILASGTKYDELSTIHSLWWAVKNWKKTEEGEMWREGGKGQGERRIELHKKAFVCKREMEGGVQFDSFLSSSFIQVVSVRLNWYIHQSFG